jgi:hypothetical protein
VAADKSTPIRAARDSYDGGGTRTEAGVECEGVSSSVFVELPDGAKAGPENAAAVLADGDNGRQVGDRPRSRAVQRETNAKYA